MSLNRNAMYKVTKGYSKFMTKIFYIGLDHMSISIYCYLCSCSESFNPSAKQIAKILKLSKPTVIKSLKLLKQYNIIRIVKHGSFRITNVYELIPPEDWILPTRAEGPKHLSTEEQQ